MCSRYTVWVLGEVVLSCCISAAFVGQANLYALFEKLNYIENLLPLQYFSILSFKSWHSAPGHWA